MKPVEITISHSNVVLSIENNREHPGYNSVSISVGDKMPTELLAVMLMNPHRFKITRNSYPPPSSVAIV